MKPVVLFFILFSSVNFAQLITEETLPVELYYFKYEIKSNSILLTWGTATEVDNYGFNLQRSTDLSEWIDLQFLFGYGTSNIPRDYSYEDTTVEIGSTYHYRLQQIDIVGTSSYSDTLTVMFVTDVRELSEMPQNVFYLYQNYPNPFNSSTKIKFEIGSQSLITLSIYDFIGNEIALLINKEMQPGIYEAEFNSSLLPELASGIYLLKFTTDNFLASKKMIILK
jgi:hypothetical protein